MMSEKGQLMNGMFLFTCCLNDGVKCPQAKSLYFA